MAGRLAQGSQTPGDSPVQFERKVPAAKQDWQDEQVPADWEPQEALYWPGLQSEAQGVHV